MNFIKRKTRITFLVGILLTIFLIVPFSSFGMQGSDDSQLNSNSFSSPKTQQTPAEWTYLIYLCGDNNLDQEGFVDMNELESGFQTTNDVNVIVYWDRLNAPAYIYEISADSNNSTIASTRITPTFDLEPNMGNASTLTWFLNFAATAYPANNWALNFWDHGGGIYGVCFDDSADSDGLSIDEISTVLDASSLHFDIISFDACLMNLIEWVYELQDYCDYVVGSEENIPGSGYDYVPIIQGLTTTPMMSDLTLAELTVDSYHNFYLNKAETTLAVIDTSELDSFLTVFGAFSSALINGLDIVSKIELTSYREYVLMMGDYDFIDLYDFVYRINQNSSITSWISASSNVIAAFSDLVVKSKQTSLPNAHGLSIFFPVEFNDLVFNYYINRFTFANITFWGQFLEEFFDLETLRLEWNNLILEETIGNNDNLIGAGESANISIGIQNSGEILVENIQAQLQVKNSSLGASSSSQTYGNLTINGTKMEQFSMSLSSEAINGSVIDLQLILTFDVLSVTSVEYIIDLFFISNFNGSYLYSQNTFNNAIDVSGGLFAGKISQRGSGFYLALSLGDEEYILTEMTHSEKDDFDIYLLNEDANYLEYGIAPTSPEIMGYDAISAKDVIVWITSYFGEGLFLLNLTTGSCWDIHTEAGSWAYNPIFITESSSFINSINGPGFMGLTYYYLTLGTSQILDISLTLDDTEMGLATFYVITENDYYDAYGQWANQEFTYTSVFSEDMYIIIYPIYGDTIYNMSVQMKISLTPVIIGIVTVIILISIAVYLIRRKRNRKRMDSSGYYSDYPQYPPNSQYPQYPQYPQNPTYPNDQDSDYPPTY